MVEKQDDVTYKGSSENIYEDNKQKAMDLEEG